MSSALFVAIGAGVAVLTGIGAGIDVYKRQLYGLFFLWHCCGKSSLVFYFLP